MIHSDFHNHYLFLVKYFYDSFLITLTFGIVLSPHQDKNILIPSLKSQATSLTIIHHHLIQNSEKGLSFIFICSAFMH